MEVKTRPRKAWNIAHLIFRERRSGGRSPGRICLASGTGPVTLEKWTADLMKRPSVKLERK